MQKALKIIGKSMVALGTVTFMGGAFAASSRVGVMTNTVRMPSMPTANVSVTSTTTVPTTPTPTPTTCSTSKYTVDACMNDILNCVNGGALPNGMNDLFDENVRTSIFSGMNLCVTQVDKCIAEVVDKNCNPIYVTQRDVWIDFNSRKVQPTYYYFVLQKTGLTPNQAENTCWLLDKNTYGSSFTAVSATNKVTQEYDKNVSAYNTDEGSLNKANPMGAAINTNGVVDAQRGHYARWDAKTAQCLIRVAAYNKDKHITNKWLGLGDDTPAEVWQSAGSTFTCNKDLFGFSLMLDTKSAALIAVPGGALLGAGVGAGVGHAVGGDGTYVELDCDVACVRTEWQEGVKDYLKELEEKDPTTARQLKGSDDKTSCLNVCNQDDVKFVINDTTGVQRMKQAGDEDVIINKQMKDGLSPEGKGALIGTAVGAGAGGIATAITAFVERNNISCHVGDNLGKVSYEKSYSIDSLRDFYVKWNLNVPEAAVAPVVVDSCATWQAACARYTDLNECVAAQFNYKQTSGTTQVFSPCVASGNACVENPTLTKSYGVCP